MKKTSFISFFFGFILLFMLFGCGEIRTTDHPEKPHSTTQKQQETETITSETGSQETLLEHDSDVLVIVFSATGTTRGVAEMIAAQTGADLKEIIPTEPYSADDLKYSDSNSRTSREQNDPNARPGIAEDISISGYRTIFLGYPIWWGQAPRILSTFVERHDFAGITVIPFCTSGSSDIGTSDDTLASQAGSGNWIQGKRFPGNVSENELQKWIDEKKPAETGETTMERTLHLLINGTEVAVAWENNESVKALTEMASAKTLTIQMSMYGGFEQVGSLGRSLPRNDVQTTTSAGDIVLYSGDQIVVFYGSNSWAYTRLGKITDQNASDLANLLGNGNVTLTITCER